MRSDEAQAQAERLAVSLMDDQTRQKYMAAVERNRELTDLRVQCFMPTRNAEKAACRWGEAIACRNSRWDKMLVEC